MLVNAGGSFGTYVDLDGTIRTEAELVTKYRDMAMQPELDRAIDEIVNEGIEIADPEPVAINLDRLAIDDKIKQLIMAEFNNALRLLDFYNYGSDIFKKWYIDGRLYYHCVVDTQDVRAGIQELRYIDPRKIRKVREIKREKLKNEPAMAEGSITRLVNEYYVYNDRGFNRGAANMPATLQGTGQASSGIKVTKDAIVYVPSGLTDNYGSMVLSYLHKAIKPLNQLRTLEDAVVIYRLVRAPERRVWYIDVGSLPKAKAEQHLTDIMTKHKNKVVYDASTGNVRDDRKFLTMLEDYWLPRREGGRGTEVTTLPAGENLGKLDDIVYFQKNLYRCLNVPMDRLDENSGFNLGRSSEITREEIKFAKFVVKLRNKFSNLFLQIIEKQLILKNIATLDDWNEIKQDIRFDYATDNYFSELKAAEILGQRIELAINMIQNGLVGRYYSDDYIRHEVLHQSAELMQQMDMQIAMNSQNPQYMTPDEKMMMLQAQEGGGGQPGGGEQQPPFDDGDSEPESPEEKLIWARKVYNTVKAKKKEMRTKKEQSDYNRASQVLAKNKHGVVKHALQATASTKTHK